MSKTNQTRKSILKGRTKSEKNKETQIEITCGNAAMAIMAVSSKLDESISRWMKKGRPSTKLTPEELQEIKEIFETGIRCIFNPTENDLENMAKETVGRLMKSLIGKSIGK